ncbi:MAG: hypothetical protein U5L96_07190 [Owenweeksia sp.]|nr:hypothetical protein [Owenweeksia sp.]
MECIDFDGLNEGEIPNQLYTVAGSGPIGVNRVNPNNPLPNSAMVFNSAMPTGGDPDLGTPHSDFGGPGIGAGGAAGAPNENNTPLGNLMIVSADLDTTDPDDLNDEGELHFDFTAIGPVTVHKMTIVDVEGKEGPPTVRFYNAAGALFKTITLTTVGDNGVAQVNLGPVTGVSKMQLHFEGSGAVGDLCLETTAMPAARYNASVESVLFEVNGSLLQRKAPPPGSSYKVETPTAPGTQLLVTTI